MLRSAPSATTGRTLDIPDPQLELSVLLAVFRNACILSFSKPSARRRELGVLCRIGSAPHTDGLYRNMQEML